MEISIRCRISCSAEWQRGEKTDIICILSTLVHPLVVCYLPAILLDNPRDWLTNLFILCPGKLRQRSAVMSLSVHSKAVGRQLTNTQEGFIEYLFSSGIRKNENLTLPKLLEVMEITSECIVALWHFCHLVVWFLLVSLPQQGAHYSLRSSFYFWMLLIFRIL